MKRLMLAVGILSTGAFAQESAFKDWNYEVRGCESDDVCTIQIEAGSLDSLMSRSEDPALLETFRASNTTKGKGARALTNSVASATGMVTSAVATAINGIRDAAVSAGFDTFTGTLSGPSGSITFKMNLGTGAWAFWGGSLDENLTPPPAKELMPDFGPQ